MRKLKRSNCVVMPLVLKHKWYDMIDKGDKREEYRDDTNRYAVRFANFASRAHVYIGPIWAAEKLRVVAFSKGYTKPDMFWLCKVVFRDAGIYEHPEWGEPNEPHWVVKLLERVELED